MKFIKKSIKLTNRQIGIFLIIAFLMMFFPNLTVHAIDEKEKDQVKQIIEEIIINRNKAILNEDVELIEEMYNQNTRYGMWACEHEKRKIKYVHNWEQKQGVKFIDINPTVIVKNIKGSGNRYSIYLLCSTEYQYVYENEETINTSRIGTYHSITLVNKEGRWIIEKEWYKDPFADSLNINNIKVDDIREFALNQKPRTLTNLNKRRIKAVEYAERYSGAASEEKYGFKYNSKYRDFNVMGGDCANFASQILHEGGGFRKNSVWNYEQGEASRAWVNADGFKNYMLNSGRASLIAYGTYEKVYKASYKLLPGDFVAYEKKGDIVHISVVTAVDSKGYSLVTCHNTDRNKVPWDMGWSDKNIKFWLVRVHY